jgi:GntR family transcriptional regulator
MTQLVTRNSHVPLFMQIEEELRAMIDNGKLGHADRLPSENELTARFAVSRVTIRKALGRLVDEGILVRRPGKGTFVAPAKIDHIPSQALSFSESMRDHGLTSSTVVLAALLTPLPAHVADPLKQPHGEQGVYIRRLRFVENDPVAIHASWLPMRYAAILDHDLSGSLTDILDRMGAQVAEVHDVIEAAQAADETARLLHTDEQAPLIHIGGIAYGADGQPIRHSEALYRGDRFKFHVVSGPRTGGVHV